MVYAFTNLSGLTKHKQFFLNYTYIFNQLLFLIDSPGSETCINLHAQARGTQWPNVSKYTRSVSNGFLCGLEACLVNLKLP